MGPNIYKNIKYLLVTDIPAPWREKVYEKVYKIIGEEFHVVYCAYNEERRLWRFPLGSHAKTFLKSLRVCIGKKERWINLGLIPFLIKNKPKIVICFSLQPTVVIGFILARFLKSKIAILSDTWLGRDADITWVQKIVRKIAYNYFSDAFIGASKQTLKMFKHYNKGINDDSLFLSWLCADNEYFNEYIKDKNIEKEYDVLFSGRIVEIKNPIFFAQVAKRIKEKIGKCKVLIIGEGDEKIKSEMFKLFREKEIEYDFPGFIEHNKLPEYYAKAKILLFPTSKDCWGVVINEALVSGLPVITTNMTAAAGELVIDGENGYILPMDLELWADKICSLLKDTRKYDKFSKCAFQSVEKFNFTAAANGIIQTIRYLEESNNIKENENI